jgi:hypothetical protein
MTEVGVVMHAHTLCSARIPFILPATKETMTELQWTLRVGRELGPPALTVDVACRMRRIVPFSPSLSWSQMDLPWLELLVSLKVVF